MFNPNPIYKHNHKEVYENAIISYKSRNEHNLRLLMGIFFYLSLLLIGTGLHNVDLAHNGIGDTDCNIFGCHSFDQVYIYGLTALLIGIAMQIGIIVLFVFA
jgi:hypothetical protein